MWIKTEKKKRGLVRSNLNCLKLSPKPLRLLFFLSPIEFSGGEHLRSLFYSLVTKDAFEPSSPRGAHQDGFNPRAIQICKLSLSLSFRFAIFHGWTANVMYCLRVSSRH